MGRNLRTLIEYEIKRSPNIAIYFSNIDSLSLDDIENLPIKSWMKKGFKLLKSERPEKIIQASQEANIIAKTRFFYAPDTKGHTFQHIGSDTYVKLDRGELELRTDALFWICETGGVLYETLFSKFIDRRISANLIGPMTRTEYVAAYKQKANDSAPLDAQQIILGKANPLVGLGVTISK